MASIVLRVRLVSGDQFDVTYEDSAAADEDEVAEGLVVTCQALPTSPTIRFVYE